MARWMREAAPHDLDSLSTQQFREIADGHDLEKWDAQQEGFAQLRDLCDDLARGCRDGLERLREGWSGAGADGFARAFGAVVEVLEGLRDSAASNSTGMREISVVAREARQAAADLDEEDRDWRVNPDGDDEQTLSLLREKVREDARDKAKDASQTYRRLADSYLRPPPEPLRWDVAGHPAREHVGDATTDVAEPSPQPTGEGASSALASHDSEDATIAGSPARSPGPTLQSSSAAAQVPAPVEAAPATAPPAETPMMPATGAPMAPSVGAAEAGPADRRAQGVSFGEARHRPLSRMRSDASRQELLNRAQYGEPARVDPQEQRRAVDADPDSPLTPSDNTVVPGVITGGAPEGPHDSGPVLTGTAYRHYPEYYEPEPEPEEQEVYEEEYEDGSSVAVEYAPPPKDDAVDEPDPAPAENRSAVDRAEAAESETESRLFATRLQGKDFLDALRNLPGGKAKEFIAAQRALREAEDAEGGASPDAKAD